MNNTTVGRAMDSRSESHGAIEAGLPCVHQILHRMKALVISIWGLCTTEGKVRMQVPMSPMGGTWLCKCMIRAVGELDCSRAHIRLREPDKSVDKVK